MLRLLLPYASLPYQGDKVGEERPGCLSGMATGLGQVFLLWLSPSSCPLLHRHCSISRVGELIPSWWCDEEFWERSRQRERDGSMASMPRPKTKRIGRRRGRGIETVTARETEVNCSAGF